MREPDLAARTAARFDGRFLKGYVRSKLRSDPVYRAVVPILSEQTHPLADIGCGVGLLPILLRESGFKEAIVGLDFDTRKIAQAKRHAASSGVEFRVADARQPYPPGHSVVLLDLLHYFSDADQRAILDHAAAAVPPGGVVVIRDGIRDGSWRYRATWLAEVFARAVSWLRAERLHFPTIDQIAAAFPGYEKQVLPMWGKTPFNNYLLVFRKPEK